MNICARALFRNPETIVMEYLPNGTANKESFLYT